MGDADIYALLGTDEPTAQEQARAMAQALRKQQADARQQQDVGALLQFTGDKVLAPAGQSYASVAQSQAAEAQHGQDQLGQMLRDRLHRKTEADHWAAQQAFQRGEVKNREAQLQLQREEMNKRRFVSSNPNSVIFDSTNGQVVPQTSGPGGAPPAPRPLMGTALDKALIPLRNDIDASLGRNGAFGKDKALSNSADKVVRLINSGPNGTPNYNLTTKQIPELIQSVAAMVSSGTAPAQSQIEHMLPHTLKGTLAEKLEWLTGHPEEANTPEFVKQALETALRESQGANERIRGVQLNRLPFHQGGFKSNPKEFKAAAAQYLPDLTPEELEQAFQGQYKGKAKAAATSGGPAAPTHYLVSPDGTMRIPAGPDGKPLPGAAPEPNPTPPKVASNG